MSEGSEPGPPFAFFGKVGRSPRIYACSSRDAILRQIQATALNKMGITVAREFSCFKNKLQLETSFQN